VRVPLSEATPPLTNTRTAPQVATPFVIMFAAAYACVVPGLSLALGAQCNFY